jgi:hypothetical protein
VFNNLCVFWDVTTAPLPLPPACAVDSTAPDIALAPAPNPVEAKGPDGAIASYTLPSAQDLVEGLVPVDCKPASGSQFKVGTTIVSCSAADSKGNTASKTFNVAVGE